MEHCTRQVVLDDLCRNIDYLCDIRRCTTFMESRRELELRQTLYSVK